MIIQSTPVSFGAIATPMRTGVGDGLKGGIDLTSVANLEGSPVYQYSQLLEESPSIFNGQTVTHFIETSADGVLSINGGAYDTFISYISHYVASMHFVGGLCIPLLLCAFLTKGFGVKKSYSEGLAVWPFAFFAALAFTIPYVLINFFLNFELTSMLGALIGLVIVTSAANAGFLMPKKNWDFLPEDQWDPGWKGTITVEYVEKEGGMSTALAWTPYIFVAALILITRLVPAFKAFLTAGTQTIRIGPIGGVSASWQILYSPGMIFIVVSLLTVLIHGMKWPAYIKALKRSAKTMVGASTALIFTVPMVQVFINSKPVFLDGAVVSGLDPATITGMMVSLPSNNTAMPYVLAAAAHSLAAGIWPFIAPVVGGLGAFVAGSNTVSNMTFSLFQFTTAQLIVSTDPVLSSAENLTWANLHWPAMIVALQAIGGAAGNVICVHNVVAAAAVVGFLGREGIVIRRTFLVFIYYCLIPASAGYMFLYSPKSIFNAGTVILILFYAAVVYVLATNNSRLKKIGSHLAN
jgi:lactate permease